MIENECEERGLELIDENNYEQINKGDAIIWHPKLLHGGSNVVDPSLTRYSMVTHNVPINHSVFNASHFFVSEPTTDYLTHKKTYEYLNFNNIKYFNHRVQPRVQNSYI